MQEFDPIDVEFILNSPEVKQRSQEIKKDISGVGFSAEKATKKITDSTKKQSDALSNMSGRVKQTANDAVQAFDQLDPALQRQIRNLVAYENQIKQLSLAEKQLQKDLRTGTITQGQYNKTLASIRAESARAQMGIASLSREVKASQGVLTQAGATSDRSWNGLQNSINQISRELPAFTYSAQTGFMAISNNIPILADEISRLRLENEKLVASGQKGVPIWKQLVSGFFSWQTLLSVGVTLLTVYGKEIGEWIMGLIRGKEAVDDMISSQEALNKAYGSTDVQKAVEAVFDLRTNLELAKDGLIDQQVVIDDYNKSIGAAAGEVDTLAEAEAGIVANSDKFIQATIYKAAALEAQQEIAKEMAEALKEQNRIEEEIIKESDRLANMSSFNSNTMPGMPFSDKQVQAARVNDLQKAQKENQELQKDIADSGGKIISQLREMSLATGLNLFGSTKVKEDAKKVLDEREKLLVRILELDTEYARKSLTKDEEELQALRDKFAKARKLVEEFNNDPKNRARRIDLTGLEETENKAVDNLQYRQGTAALKDSLEEQKRLYDQYSTAVNTFGIQEANRRFSGELDLARTYLSTLQDEYNKLSSIPESDMSGPQRERLALISEELRKETADQQKQLDELLVSLQDYNTQRELIEAEYQRKRQELNMSGNTAYMAELDRQRQAEINDLDEAHIKKMEVFQRFFAGVEGMSIKNSRQLISDVRATVAVLREEYPELGRFFDDIESKLGETERSISGRISGEVAQLAQGFRRVSQSVRDTNGELSIMLRTLGDSLARVSEVQRGLDSFQAARSSGDTFGAITAGAGVAGAIIGGFVTLGNVINSATEKQNELIKKQLEFQRQAFYGEFDINRLVRERAVEQAKINGDTLTSLIEQRKVLKENMDQVRTDASKIENIFGQEMTESLQGQLDQAQTRGQSALDALMDSVGTLLYDTGETKKIKGTGFLGLGSDTVKVFETLAGLSFEEIEKLSLRGQLTEQAEEAFQELKKLKEEGMEVERQLQEIDDQLRGIFTGGTTAGNIADSIIEGFRQGKSTVEDFADDVESLLQNAILSGFKYRFLEAPLNDLLEQLYQDNQSGDGLDSGEIDQFTEAYNNITSSALDALKQLEASTGMDFGSEGSPTGQTGLSGAIRREITEETGTELAGLFRAQYDLTKRNLDINSQSYELEKRCLDATMNIMSSSAAIETNTADTVDELRTAVVELKAINKNTKKTSMRAYDP